MAADQAVALPRRTLARPRAFDSPAIRIVGRRLLQAVPVLIGVSFLTFCLINLLPGTAAQALLGDAATPDQVAALEHQLGLDEPFFVRYAHWAGNALTGDFGHSLASGQSVSSIIAQRLPVSVELILLGFLFSLGAAIPMAILAAKKPHGIIDRINTVVSMAGLATPSFVLGLVLILVFAVKLGVLPASGWTPISAGLGPNLRTALLPSLTIAFALFCHYTRILRSDLVEQMATGDYVVTAQAKGVSPWRILLGHALRNSLFGTLTLVGLNLGTMLGNTILVEQIFGLPGIGQELLSSIQNRDLIVVEAIVCLLAVVVVLANLVTDLTYAVLDPRVRHGRSDV